MSDMQAVDDSTPSGSCVRCPCPLSSVSCQRDGDWYCCGACAGSDRCTCGCKPAYTRDLTSDVHVPGRRMFGSRHPDELRVPPGYDDRQRAFPFADRRRGR